MSMAEWQEISQALLGAEHVAHIPSEEQAKQP
jgi:hypothetical protein